MSGEGSDSAAGASEEIGGNPYAGGDHDGSGLDKEQVTIYVIKFTQEVCDRDS